jgi:hypothetical protein
MTDQQRAIRQWFPEANSAHEHQRVNNSTGCLVGDDLTLRIERGRHSEQAQRFEARSR